MSIADYIREPIEPRIEQYDWVVRYVDEVWYGSDFAMFVAHVDAEDFCQFLNDRAIEEDAGARFEVVPVKR